MIISIVLYHYAAVDDWKTLQLILLYQEGPQKHFYHIIFAEKWKKGGASEIDKKSDLYANISLIWKGLPVRNTFL